MDMKAVNEQVIREHRAGLEITVPGMHRERIVLLTTTGETSGTRSTAPMLLIPSDDGVLVVASNNAAPEPPHWFRNLVADPAVHVEEPDREYDAIAEVLDDATRETTWQRIILDYPFLVEQQEQAGRPLPLVRLVEA
jgi:deazaflavin-dependent oxidoreductase (nitroreductase family)